MVKHSFLGFGKKIPAMTKSKSNISVSQDRSAKPFLQARENTLKMKSPLAFKLITMFKVLSLFSESLSSYT